MRHCTFKLINPLNLTWLSVPKLEGEDWGGGGGVGVGGGGWREQPLAVNT